MLTAHNRQRRNLVLMGLPFGLFVAGCAEAPRQIKPPEIPVFPPPPEQPRFYWEMSIYSSADAKPEDKDNDFKRLVTGEQQTGEGMAKPYGVAVRRGRIYVGDTIARNVALFDMANKRYKQIGGDGPGSLRSPFGLDIDAEGRLYVVDGTAKRIQVFDAEGTHLRTIGEALSWKRPSGIALDAVRRRIYVVDTGGVDTEEHFVRALDMDSGKKLFDFGKRGMGPGEFNLPRDAVVTADGSIYVVDGGNFRVQVFDANGKFVKTFGEVGRQGGQFSRPKEIAADKQGNVYVVDSAFGNFQIFNPEGRLLLDVGMRGNSDGPARFMLPSGIAVDDDGRVYMVDQFFRKVDVFRPAGLPAGSPFGPR